MSFRSRSDSEGVTELGNLSMYSAFAERLKHSGHGFTYRQDQHDIGFDLLVATLLATQSSMEVVQPL